MRPDQHVLTVDDLPQYQGHVFMAVERIAEGDGSERAAPCGQVGLGDIGEIGVLIGHLPP
ncbi:hypothetical protein GCM10009800_51150 [Nocardiopsis rhodophaea]